MKKIVKGSGVHRFKGSRVIIALCLFSFSLCSADSGRILDVNDDPYFISSPYDGNNLRGIQYAQLNDVMYLTHPNYPPQKLIRFDHADWTIADANFEDGPFLTGNTNDNKTSTVTADGITGDVNIVATDGIFDANHVGALWQISHLVESVGTTKSFFSLLYPDGTEESSSVTVLEGQEYVATTSGIWTGTFNIQRSYDAGSTWEKVYGQAYKGDGNIQYSGFEENETCIYRMQMVGQSIGSGGGSGGIADALAGSVCLANFNTLVMVYRGNVKITSVADADNVVATVRKDLASTDETWRWAEGAWSDYRGWPRAVCFYQNRLCLASTLYESSMLWCSQSGDHENMDLGTGLDNEAIARQIGAAGGNPIMWIKDKKGIIAGTTGAIIKIGTPSTKWIFTPSTISSERSVETGACSIQPGLTNSSIVYVDRNRRKVRDLLYDVSVDDLVSPDLTIFSDDISEPNIQEMAWQKRPDELGWFVKDSNMVTMTYNPAQGVAAWTQIVTDGNYVSVCVIPGLDEDEVWVAVARDSNDFIMIEKFHKQNWVDDVWFVDSGLEYSGVATDTLTGLGHLEGKEVQVYSDANGYIGDFTVSSGSITLNSTETQAIAGLGYTATIKTMPIEVAGPLGPSVGMKKNIRLITLALYQSEGGRYGYDDMYPIDYPSYSTDFFTGLARHGMDTGYQLEVFVIIDQNEPLPLGVTGIAINKYELSTDF